MKINFQTKGVIITSKQKSIIEKKISKVKRYLNNVDPVIIDVLITDESGPEKGGVDQKVHINVIMGKDNIFIEEVDDRIMRAFAFAFLRLERNLRRRHQKIVETDQQIDSGRLEKVFGMLKRKRRVKK